MTASSHPFGFHVPGPMPAPVPLHHAQSLQATVNPDVPAASAPEPVFPMCVACGNRRNLAARGRERYRSGAQVLVCKDGCRVGPVQAAAGVIGAAMSQGAATPMELAQAAENAALLFHPQIARDIADGARDQALADVHAVLAQAQEDAASLGWFHSRYLAVGQLCAGRRPDHLLTVSEVLAAIDGAEAPGGPLGITWTGVVAPSGDRRESTLVGFTTARGGSAVLALHDDERADLAAKLGATVQPAEACATPGCGISAEQLDASNPFVSGWIRIEVAGADDGPRWWCTPSCATAAMTAAADQLAAIAPATHAAAGPPHGGDTGRVVDEVARCHRCGCTEDHACQGGCHWLPNPQMIDLCSACATPQELAYAAGAPQGGWGAAS